MIIQNEMLPMLVAVCPSFSDKLRENRKIYEEITYSELGLFANHLVDLYEKNEIKDFPKIFEVIEQLHIEGNEYVKEAATVGLLEGIQNIAGNRGLNPEEFLKYLNPASAKWWNELNKFWNGENQFVGQTLK